MSQVACYLVLVAAEILVAILQTCEADLSS